MVALSFFFPPFKKLHFSPNLSQNRLYLQICSALCSLATSLPSLPQPLPSPLRNVVSVLIRTRIMTSIPLPQHTLPMRGKLIAASGILSLRSMPILASGARPTPLKKIKPSTNYLLCVPKGEKSNISTVMTKVRPPQPNSKVFAVDSMVVSPR